MIGHCRPHADGELRIAVPYVRPKNKRGFILFFLPRVEAARLPRAKREVDLAVLTDQPQKPIEVLKFGAPPSLRAAHRLSRRH